MKVNFKKQKRKIPFLCTARMYRVYPHYSRGDIITINSQGPYCHHCANMITRNVHLMNKTMEA